MGVDSCSLSAFQVCSESCGWASTCLQTHYFSPLSELKQSGKEEATSVVGLAFHHSLTRRCWSFKRSYVSTSAFWMKTTLDRAFLQPDVNREGSMLWDKSLLLSEVKLVW